MGGLECRAGRASKHARVNETPKWEDGVRRPELSCPILLAPDS